MSGRRPPLAVLPSAVVGAMLRAVKLEIERRTWRGTREADLQVAMGQMLAQIEPTGPLVPFTVHREYTLPPFDFGEVSPPRDDLGGVNQALVDLARERILSDARPPGRLDFAIVLEAKPPNVIAIEMKVAGGVTEVAVQVQRYARHPDIAAVMLATTAPRLAWGMPSSLAGKAVVGVVMRRM